MCVYSQLEVLEVASLINHLQLYYIYLSQYSRVFLYLGVGVLI